MDSLVHVVADGERDVVRRSSTPVNDRRNAPEISRNQASRSVFERFLRFYLVDHLRANLPRFASALFLERRGEQRRCMLALALLLMSGSDDEEMVRAILAAQAQAKAAAASVPVQPPAELHDAVVDEHAELFEKTANFFQ